MMKKSIFWKITGLVTLIFGLGAGFTSCHDNIYGMIEMEVVQEEGLNGDISQIVPFNGYLWCTNFNLYKKSAEPSSSTGKHNGAWRKVDTNLNGSIATLASDGTRLYCYTIDWEEDSDDSVNIPYYKRVYSSSDGETWTQINISSVTGLGNASDSYAENTVVHVFDNRAGDGSNSFTGRKAYVRLYDASAGTMKVYELSGTSLGSAASGTEANTFSAAYRGGTTYFSNSLDMIGGPNKIYRTSGSDIQYSSDGSSWESVDFDNGTIYALALTSDYLLVGTTKGIFRSSLDSNGVPSASASDFNNNAQSLLTSRVTGLYVLDASRSEGDTDEYGSMIISGYLSSSSDTFDEIGLYAYYPGRGVWNRDGD